MCILDFKIAQRFIKLFENPYAFAGHSCFAVYYTANPTSSMMKRPLLLLETSLSTFDHVIGLVKSKLDWLFKQ